MISLELNTRFFQYLNAVVDQSNFFNKVRVWPVISTLSGITEAALNTACAIAELPIVFFLQTTLLITYSTPLRKHISPFADDSLRLLEKHLKNIAFAFITAVPIIGNYVAIRDRDLTHRLLTAQDEINEYTAVATRTSETPVVARTGLEAQIALITNQLEMTRKELKLANVKIASLKEDQQHLDEIEGKYQQLLDENLQNVLEVRALTATQAATNKAHGWLLEEYIRLRQMTRQMVCTNTPHTKRKQ